MDTRALARRSVEVIRGGQHPSGGYVACPTFPPYGFSWLRDGSFIADAMSRVGEADSADAFFDWCARVVLARRGAERLAARYTLEGEDDATEWPLLQHDGWGLWLWALHGHCERHGRSPHRWEEAVDATAGYLERVWREPCTDWWEERRGRHRVTLACLAAGLRAWDRDPGVDLGLAEERLDASLLALVPLGLAAPDDLAGVEALVSPGGGVHRHLEDVYYGGGEWLLLTAFRGWERLVAGDEPAARACLDWVVAHATDDGLLPEQSQDQLLHPETWDEWVAKWGPPPCPLLWSHAMFLTLANALGDT